jgi:hypothetical protein
MATIVPRTKLEPPPLPKGWFSLSYSISLGGQLARMCTNKNVKSLRQKRELPYSSIVPAGTLARIDVFEEGQHFEGPAFELEVAFPIFDRLSDGRWIVTDSRCPVGTQNARIVGSDGTIARRFCLGWPLVVLLLGFLDRASFGRGSLSPLGQYDNHRGDGLGR